MSWIPSLLYSPQLSSSSPPKYRVLSDRVSTGLSCISSSVYYMAHYRDVIMSTMASQITSLTIVSSTVYSVFRRRSTKTSKFRVTGLCVGNSPVTGEFPAQMASNAENVSLWWRHHILTDGRTGPCHVECFYTLFPHSAVLWGNRSMRTCLDSQYRTRAGITSTHNWVTKISISPR